MYYLNTPPTTPVTSKVSFGHRLLKSLSLEETYKLLNINIIQSSVMPNASKVKASPFKWEEIKYIVEHNQLELFARSQEETVRYLDFKHRLKKAGVSILDHIIKQELHWKEDALKQEGDFFSDPSTTTVIYNQFPYYFEPQVKHLCAWSKVYIPADPNSPCGDISPETRAKIDDYVFKTFIEPNGLDKENICWFKNWESLQSVKSISHIHILINDVDGVIN